jgi:hypothetical protein
MKTVLIKEKLHHYIETAGEKKLKAIYAIVEDDIQEPVNVWEDKNFVAELERREKAYKNGTAKMFSLAESVKKAKQAVKKAKAAK